MSHNVTSSAKGSKKKKVIFFPKFEIILQIASQNEFRLLQW